MKRIVQKHGKIIMAILGVVLMIVFALPSFTGRGADTSGVKVGTVDGRKVTSGELAGAQMELEIVTDVSQQKIYDQYHVWVERDQVLSQLELDSSNPRLHWFLLAKEAARWGYDSIPFTESSIDSSIMSGLIKKYPGLRNIDVVIALKHQVMIEQARQFVRNFPVSIPALELAAERGQSRVQVAYALFDAAQGWESAKTFSDDEIKKQFELYKAVIRSPLPSSAQDERPAEPGEINGHHYPFGYKHPNRVKVDYLVFDRSTFLAKTGVTIEDQKAALAAFNKLKKADNKLEYTDEERAKLEGDQVGQRVTEEMKSVAEQALAQLSEPWKTSDAVPPEKWVKYPTVVENLGKRGDYKAVEEWTTEEDLAKVPLIGKAYFRSEGKNAYGDPMTLKFSFPAMALRVKELQPAAATAPAKQAVKDPIDRLGMQVGVEGRWLTDDVGNLYLFRVTAVEASHEATLEEARPHVIEDLKMLDRLASMQDAAKAFAERSRKADMLALAAAEKPTIEAKKTVDFSSLDQNNRDFPEGKIRGLVKAAFSLVPPVSKSPRPITEPPTTAAADIAATQAAGVGDTTMFVDESALRAYAVELTSVRPASSESFGEEVQAELRPMGGYQMPESMRPLLYAAEKDTLQAFSKYFSLENVIAREKWVETK